MPQDLLKTINGPHDLKALSVDQLPQLADELRECICDQISRTGGHFASNLCVVELTIALHYVFDFAQDRLLFDVGHQCYPHKLLTGRQKLFPELKTKGGMAGFPEPRESEFDLFSVGHAGTAIPTAVGMAIGDTAIGEGHRRCVSIIGDASIINGVSMEGMNYAGTLNRQFLTILNDNGMAIGDPQGAVAQYFDRIRVSHTFDDLKKRGKEILEMIPGGSYLEDFYHRSGEVIKAAISTGHVFEHFGHVCVGPLDGHDLPTLVDLFNEVKDIEKPILLHVKTVKGKGYVPAEGDPFRFHAPKAGVVVNGNGEKKVEEALSKGELEKSDCSVVKKPACGGKSFTAAFADGMKGLMAKDEKVYAITAAMPDGTGLDKVAEAYPDRTIDCGLAESLGMDMAAGMAKSGLKPFYAVYSTFSQRALDQTFQEVALQGLPVRVCMDRAGYVGGDGAMMHGFMDIAMNAVFPDVVMMAPSDESNFNAGLEFMRGYEKSATFIRYPRDVVAAEELQADVPKYELGKANLIKKAKGKKPDVAVLAYGVMVYTAAEAIRELEGQGYDVALYDARFAKPVDMGLVTELIEGGIPVVTVEDHGIVGGFGTMVLEGCNEAGLRTDKLKRIAHPEKWMYQDSRGGQLKDAGLDATGVASTIRKFLDKLSHDVNVDVKTKSSQQVAK
ncbi:1-deoxy-D-xylulose-5-phosphate synthase [Poriferisphaera corsica]|uniref:1-deoxy-D-xylulose-5-phosphate synthase n=1 Tax=Poriferisphaera corsica TaxID=2528020 RepID=A0A517YR17_9BACT|nr:1-deoxy-D-xylulose-5-phosphate synthase [Poriferisphaera corsica]QDU32670.1 1-deoxy-D-xylulose-5-phosphate synthase [Poriferisphaera corsica]